MAAISSLDATAAQEVLIKLMVKSFAIETEIHNLLLLSTNKEGPAASGWKRKALGGWEKSGPAKKVNTDTSVVKRYVKCAQCNKQFDTCSNFGKICERHPGTCFTPC